MPPPPPSSRVFVPSAVVLVVALVASVGAHMQAYGVLGDLRALLASASHDGATSSEIEFVLTDPPQTPEAEDVLTEPEPLPTEPESPPPEHRERHPRPRHPERPHPRAVRPPPPAPPPETPPPPAPTPAEASPAPPPSPPPPEERARASIRQHSQNPDEPAPEDAEYISDENSHVEDETVAQITSATHDDPIPSAGPPEEASTADTPGESDESVVADMRDSEGSDERLPTPEEAERDDPEEATSDPSHSPTPTASMQGTDATSAHEEQVESGTPSLGDEGGTRALGGQPMSEVMISDGFGSYTVLVPRSAARGDGGGETGGHHREGTGRGTTGHGVYAGHVGREGGAPHEHAEGEREGPQLGVTYSQLEAVYGEERLEHERVARLERRRSHARGSASAEMFDRFRAASENYIAGIRPGNQTALNAAASPFAHFIYDMHVRIHPQYAQHYLSTLPMDPEDALNDMNLHATLEIALNPDGSVFQVGIVETSGQTLFDLGVFTAFYRAQPFPHPPSIILSGDGHAWLRWRFDRGPGQCGTWNAHPFLLDNGERPPETTTDAVSDADLPPEQSEGSPIEMVPSAPTVPSTALP